MTSPQSGIKQVMLDRIDTEKVCATSLVRYVAKDVSL